MSRETFKETAFRQSTVTVIEADGRSLLEAASGRRTEVEQILRRGAQ